MVKKEFIACTLISGLKTKLQNSLALHHRCVCMVTVCCIILDIIQPELIHSQNLAHTDKIL